VAAIEAVKKDGVGVKSLQEYYKNKI
jgi:hypothetical protein